LRRTDRYIGRYPPPIAEVHAPLVGAARTNAGIAARIDRPAPPIARDISSEKHPDVRIGKIPLRRWRQGANLAPQGLRPVLRPATCLMAKCAAVVNAQLGIACLAAVPGRCAVGATAPALGRTSASSTAAPSARIEIAARRFLFRRAPASLAGARGSRAATVASSRPRMEGRLAKALASSIRQARAAPRQFPVRSSARSDPRAPKSQVAVRIAQMSALDGKRRRLPPPIAG